MIVKQQVNPTRKSPMDRLFLDLHSLVALSLYSGLLSLEVLFELLLSGILDLFFYRFVFIIWNLCKILMYLVIILKF